MSDHFGMCIQSCTHSTPWLEVGLHVAAAQPGVREIVIMTVILPLNADCTVFVSDVCFVALVLENTLL